MLNQDYRDILSEFANADVEYLLVGAYALASHGLVRATTDIDLWVNPTPDNAGQVLQALVAFGAPTDELSESSFTTPDQVVQLGVAPVRIDILTSLSGLEFSEAWERREIVELEKLEVPVLCLNDLAANKRASGRPQDLVDLKWIEDAEA